MPPKNAAKGKIAVPKTLNPYVPLLLKYVCHTQFHLQPDMPMPEITPNMLNDAMRHNFARFRDAMEELNPSEPKIKKEKTAEEKLDAYAKKQTKVLDEVEKKSGMETAQKLRTKLAQSTTGYDIEKHVETLEYLFKEHLEAKNEREQQGLVLPKTEEFEETAVSKIRASLAPTPPTPSAPVKPKKRGRPRKVGTISQSSDVSLFNTHDSSQTAALQQSRASNRSNSQSVPAADLTGVYAGAQSYLSHSQQAQLHDYSTEAPLNASAAYYMPANQSHSAGVFNASTKPGHFVPNPNFEQNFAALNHSNASATSSNTRVSRSAYTNSAGSFDVVQNGQWPASRQQSVQSNLAMLKLEPSTRTDKHVKSPQSMPSARRAPIKVEAIPKHTRINRQSRTAVHSTEKEEEEEEEDDAFSGIDEADEIDENAAELESGAPEYEEEAEDADGCEDENDEEEEEEGEDAYDENDSFLASEGEEDDMYDDEQN